MVVGSGSTPHAAAIVASGAAGIVLFRMALGLLDNAYLLTTLATKPLTPRTLRPLTGSNTLEPFFSHQRGIMPIAQQGDTVRVHYTGRLKDGTVFDSSLEREPIEFTIGENQVIKGFENAVEGLSVGAKTAAEVSPEDGYGKRSEELVMNVHRDSFPDGLSPAVGQRFEMTTKDGQKIPVKVTQASGDTVQVDANHPLAGESLRFDLELVKIV